MDTFAFFLDKYGKTIEAIKDIQDKSSREQQKMQVLANFGKVKQVIGKLNLANLTGARLLQHCHVLIKHEEKLQEVSDNLRLVTKQAPHLRGFAYYYEACVYLKQMDDDDNWNNFAKSEEIREYFGKLFARARQFFQQKISDCQSCVTNFQLS